MSRDRELNDALGLIVDLKADNADLRKRLEVAERAGNSALDALSMGEADVAFDILRVVFAKREKQKKHRIVDDDSAGLICEGCGRDYLDLKNDDQLDEPCAALAALEEHDG